MVAITHGEVIKAAVVHALGAPVLSFWRIDPSGANGCMMGPHQHSSDSDFNQACRRRINHRYGQCGAGDCFSSPECP